MKFETAKEYIKYLDEKSGESWSNATNELADAMEDYAKMYHERQLKLLGIAGVVGQSEQLPITRCECEEPDPTEIKVCVQCDGYVE